MTISILKILLFIDTMKNYFIKGNMYVIYGLIAMAIVIIGTCWYIYRERTISPTTSGTTQVDYLNMMRSEKSPTSSDIMNTKDSNIEPGKIFLNVIGKPYKFQPNEIRVKKGQFIVITFKNNGGMHDLVLDDFSIRTSKIKEGEANTISFYADKSGVFEYYCSVGDHRAIGMTGKLIVE